MKSVPMQGIWSLSFCSATHGNAFAWCGKGGAGGETRCMVLTHPGDWGMRLVSANPLHNQKLLVLGERGYQFC